MSEQEQEPTGETTAPAEEQQPQDQGDGGGNDSKPADETTNLDQ